MLQQAVSYFTANGADWLTLAIQHVSISGAALVLATVIAAPAGALASRSRVAGIMASALAGVMRVVPSLAVLILCVPYLGVGPIPAIVALTMLAVPPILINTATALQGVPAPVLEAARGMGMSRWQVFARVHAPLALPLAFTGVQTAATEVIASATLASYIGAGGLGVLIQTGIGALRFDLLWIGGLSVAMLSLLVNHLLAHIGRRLRRHELATATPSPASTEAVL